MTPGGSLGSRSFRPIADGLLARLFQLSLDNFCSCREVPVMKISDFLKLTPVKIRIGSTFLLIIAVLYFSYWYVKTPRDTTLIGVDAFPSEVKPGFTGGGLANDIAADLREILAPSSRGKKKEMCEATRSLGPETVRSQLNSTPVPLPSGPTPLFDGELKGVSLNLLRA